MGIRALTVRTVFCSRIWKEEAQFDALVANNYLIFGFVGGYLDEESTNFFMDTPAPNVGNEVGSAVFGNFLFPLLGEGTPLCSFFGTW